MKREGEKNEKKRSAYNISEEVLNKFDKLTDERAINRSALIEILMSNWIKKCDDGVYAPIEKLY